MRAFIRAMERRHAEGLPLDRHSVASFFVSRVDTEVDKRLAALGREDLQGRAGLANARAAYQAFQRVFGGEEFAALRDAGLPGAAPAVGVDRRQEPGVPRHALRLRARRPGHGQHDAAADAAGRGRRGRGDRPDGRRGPGRGPRGAGARPGSTSTTSPTKLLRDGIEAFVVPMNKLLAGIEAKREAIVTGRPAVVRGRPARRARAAGRRAAAPRPPTDDVVRRVWRKDGTLWAPPGHARARGPARLADDRRQAARGPAAIAGVRRASVRADGHHRRRAARHGRLEPRARGLPALQPAVGGRAAPARARLDRAARGRGASPTRSTSRTTLFIVSSKSGGTIEPNALLAHFRALPARPVALRRRSPTRARRCTSSPSARASAASFLVRPGDRRALLRAVAVRHRPGRARRRRRPGRARGRAGRGGELRAAGGQLGPLARRRARRARRAAGATSSRSSSTRRSASFGLWAEQLVAESTGKQGRGILPIADEPLVDPSRYGPDRVFVHLRDADAPDPRHAEAVERARGGRPPDDHADRDGRERPRADLLLRRVRRPPSPAGRSEINPFDQPNVQEAKDNTAKVLERGRAGGPRGRLARPTLLDGLAAARVPGDHGLPAVRRRRSTPRSRELRAAVIERHGVATTWGYGPRFLHSTGQFHKGGPPTGRFLQLVHDAHATTSRSPGKPYSFRTLIDAQADGDLQTLRDARPARRARAPARRRPRRRDHPTPGASSRCNSASSASARWAATWSIASCATRTTRSSPSTSTPHAVTRPPRATARPARTRSRTSSPKLEAPRMVWLMVPSGDPTRADGRRARRRCSRPGDTIVDGGNTKWHDDVRRAATLDAAGHPLRRRRHVRRRLGPRGRLLHDGRRPRGLGAAARADPRRARPAGRLAPLRRRGRRPLREDGPQRRGVRDHAGLRRGLRADAQVEVPDRAQGGRRRSGTAARSSAPGCCELAERAFEEEGNDLEGSRATCRTPARAAGRSSTAIDLDVPTPVITASLYARFYSRDEGDYTHRVLAALRNQFGGHAVERTAGGG